MNFVGVSTVLPHTLLFAEHTKDTCIPCFITLQLCSHLMHSLTFLSQTDLLIYICKHFLSYSGQSHVAWANFEILILLALLPNC